MSRSGRPSLDTSDIVLNARLKDFLAGEKALSGPVDWKPDGRNLRLTVALEIEGVTEAGLLLFGRASLTLRNSNVTLGLSFLNPTGRGGMFDRFDWRPLGPHTNKGRGPANHRFSIIDGTHHHPLAENAALEIGIQRAVQENLPVALPVDPEPADWSSFLALAAQRWRLHELVHTPLPPWQYDLLMP